jgi:hypothetical protein
MKPAQTLQLVRRTARRHALTVQELPGRGKSSHRIYRLLDASGAEVGRFGLTDHPRELSWQVMRGLEDGLAHLFGEKWMEQR